MFVRNRILLLSGLPDESNWPSTSSPLNQDRDGCSICSGSGNYTDGRPVVRGPSVRADTYRGRSQG